jgi:hypothetical protein
MMREILSGKFPTARYRNQVRSVPHNETSSSGPPDKDDDKVSAFINKIRGRTAKCANMCCNGAFIVETMALVVMNDEIKELVFEPEPLRKAVCCCGTGGTVSFFPPKPKLLVGKFRNR